MCLFKVFLIKQNGEKELIAENIAFIEKNEELLRLCDESLKEKKTLSNVEIIKVDTLNETIELKSIKQ